MPPAAFFFLPSHHENKNLPYNKSIHFDAALYAGLRVFPEREE